MIFSFHLDLFADGNDFSWETNDRGRNRFYQQRLATTIGQQAKEITSLLTQAMSIHLNRVQQWQMSTSSVFFSIESLPLGSLTNKDIEPMKDVRMRLPATLILNTTQTESLLIRVCSFSSTTKINDLLSLSATVHPLASPDASQLASNTNLPRSISLALLDRQSAEIPLRTSPGETIRRLDGRIRFRYDLSGPGVGERLRCAVFRCDTALFTASGYGLVCPARVRLSVNSPYLHRFSLTAVYGVEFKKCGRNARMCSCLARLTEL
jgi:hypothetical protein